MSRSVKLRPWQKRAIEAFLASERPDFLAVATPGAGKTTFALTAVRLELARSGWRRVFVVVPTQHLKVQWANAAARFELHLEPEWSTAQGGLAADIDGVALTYQQVAANPEAVRALTSNGLVIFDELHHAADERAWGDGVRIAFEGAHRRLALSGTPFRSDTSAIPFVRYRLDEAESDFEYGYADALTDGRVVRPVFFPRVGGQMEWSAPDGTIYEATFDDPLARALANQRLRTALSLEGEWLPAVLSQAHRELQRIRAGAQPDAGGLVIAMDVDHARGIAALLRDRLGANAVVATSDDPDASDRIARFSASTTPWIVAVRMVSEGVDIPRLRVGVFATNTTTELFFRQAVGRLVRWQPIAGGGRQKAFLFIPDDVRLRTYANQLADQRRHSLRKPSEDAPELAPAEADPSELDALGEPEQLSLFAALSATPLDIEEESVFDDAHDEDEPPPPPGHDDAALELTLAPLRRPPGVGVGVGSVGATANGIDPNGLEGPFAGLSPREARTKLRDLNAAVAAQLALVTGQTHAQVNAELNRRVGVKRVTEATLVQLQRRLDSGRQWLDSARRSGVGRRF
ncbi:MAG: DEAD/DEAH box helicase [Acidimicrobiales bacterium]|nr:DEAD/DEAH box helicase [Acidimicrobiales bacterium]